ncbi:hypothetical protein WA026_005175 [Henosepilachna vigintioctopunctata]|uniref:MD-2-related lipid-recognition domain-containing protein n=1 Tax=Henosepilachna vigintioctopunctata TaxID=420089 RepID=A0AAW1UTX9_9CUCU
MKTVLLLTSLVCFCAVSSALNVSECYNGERGVKDIKQEITVGRCKKPPCRLKKGTSVPANSNSQLPLIPQRYGTDACKGIYKEDGKTFAGCPLKKGETYKYKNSFDILDIYPRIRLDVHWGLEGESGHVTCFEVGARITN